MRHAFRFPKHIRDAVKRHISNAIEQLSPQRFRQEPGYTAALAARIEGVAYEAEDGSVKFVSTIVDDRGRKSAESWAGADLAITATISDQTRTIQKAIMVQAKLGALSELEPRERSKLLGQVRDMKRLTRSPKVMELPTSNGRRCPRIISGNRLLDNGPYRSMALEDYVVARVLTTLDGDTRALFVSAVQDSSLTQLKVTAMLRKKTNN